MPHATMDKLHFRPCPDIGGGARCIEARLYAQARHRAGRGQFWSWLTGCPQSLLALQEVQAVCAIQAESEAGLYSVPISQIRGSEGRSSYFDREFNPLYDRARGRWLNIARARQQGKVLPPVSLVRVSDVYFVMDGHHRISVARALGQGDIQARVTIWQVTGPLPWETHRREPGPKRALKSLERGGAWLQQWASPILKALPFAIKAG